MWLIWTKKTGSNSEPVELQIALLRRRIGPAPALDLFATALKNEHGHVMNVRFLFAILSLCLPSSVYGQRIESTCDEAHTQTYGELDAALAKKAVEIITLASLANDEKRLRSLMTSEATFSLGAGDVGLPLADGPSGARAMAKRMMADSFRYFVWSSIPTPVENPCMARSIKVEFLDSRKGLSYLVTFTFENGLLVNAKGWTEHYLSGAI